MFSRTVAEKRKPSSGTSATARRSSRGSASRTSRPSIDTEPELTSYNRAIAATSVVLPDPVGPTTATVSPGDTSSVTSTSAGAPPS